ncbi:MAG: hypothetical protein ABH811_01775 [archaeon]
MLEKTLIKKNYSEFKNFKYVVLPTENNNLLKALRSISYEHSKKTGILGIHPKARKDYNQKPHEVKVENMRCNNKGEFSINYIKNLIRKNMDPFVIVIRDGDNANLTGTLFVPEGYPKNPYIRFLEF